MSDDDAKRAAFGMDSSFESKVHREWATGSGVELRFVTEIPAYKVRLTTTSWLRLCMVCAGVEWQRIIFNWIRSINQRCGPRNPKAKTNYLKSQPSSVFHQYLFRIGIFPLLFQHSTDRRRRSGWCLERLSLRRLLIDTAKTMESKTTTYYNASTI